MNFTIQINYFRCYDNNTTLSPTNYVSLQLMYNCKYIL